MKQLVYQGSVKNIYQDGDALDFEFTDNYSIFDWGIMPDQIKDKGKLLAKMAESFFLDLSTPTPFKNLTRPSFLSLESFENLISSKTYANYASHGCKNHFLKLSGENSIQVKKVQVPKVTEDGKIHDYSFYQKNPTNALIPLEVVFRLGAPKGSSYIKRYPEVREGEQFNEVVIEFYTKLEAKDRLLTYEEAKGIAGLTDTELERLKTSATLLGIFLENKFQKTPLTLWDGKFEFAFGEEINGEREIILVDSIGPDELRLTYQDFPFSKEFLRQYYKETTWAKEFTGTGKTNLTPDHLDSKTIMAATAIYESILSIIQGEFKDFPKELKTFLPKPKNIAIFGQGGREHALAHHLQNSPEVNKVFVIPGNPGIQDYKIESHTIDKKEYISFCKNNSVEFSIIGPEVLLEDGLSDLLQAEGIPCASPSQKAALLESSKAFAKDFMQKYSIPTASYANFQDTEKAINYLKENSLEKVVVKLSALAAGKGVILCETQDQAISALKKLAPNNEEIVIEDFLEGKELSFFALCLEEEFKLMGTACDYKRLKDNNKGPNTGGMGCYSPTYWLSEKDHELITEIVLKPTLKGLTAERRNFKGTLFIGIMMTTAGPKVLEYNVRFGDPETQTLLPRLSNNLYSVLKATAFNDLEKFKQSNINEFECQSIHIVKAAKGYPGTEGEAVVKGTPIKTPTQTPSNLTVYYAGVSAKNNDFFTNGGRVLGFTAIANNVDAARELAYKNLSLCSFEGEQFRMDIGL